MKRKANNGKGDTSTRSSCVTLGSGMDVKLTRPFTGGGNFRRNDLEKAALTIPSSSAGVKLGVILAMAPVLTSGPKKPFLRRPKKRCWMWTVLVVGGSERECVCVSECWVWV